MCEKLTLKCSSCHSVINSFDTSPTLKCKLIDVNLRSVCAATSTGGGLTTLRNICTALDFPAPVHPSHYSKYLKYISRASFEICNESMKAACTNLKNLYGVREIDVVDVPVSIDGTWQKRYGHNSLLGVSFIISMDTGCVLDYSVKSKVCHM